MKSFDLCECNKPLRLMERTTPTPQGSEVLLRVLAAGLCHSDLHFWGGTYDLGGGKQTNIQARGIKLPLTMGHESVGEVVAIGPDAKGVKVGDRRLACAWIGCGECPVCQRGHEHMCVKPRFLGAYLNGGFATHLMVPHTRYLFEIGDLAPEAAAPLGCAGITTFSALKKVDPTILREEPIVIVGAGGLGLMALGMLKAMGGRGAIVVDIDPVKRDAAMKAGALAVIDGAAPDAAARIKEATGGGAWAIVDLVGGSTTVQLGVDCLVRGGKLVIVGLYGGEVTIPTMYFPSRVMTVQGSYLGTLAEMEEMLALVRSGRVPAIPVTTRPLGDINTAFGDLQAGKVIGRLVLVPTE